MRIPPQAENTTKIYSKIRAIEMCMQGPLKKQNKKSYFHIKNIPELPAALRNRQEWTAESTSDFCCYCGLKKNQSLKVMKMLREQFSSYWQVAMPSAFKNVKSVSYEHVTV